MSKIKNYASDKEFAREFSLDLLKEWGVLRAQRSERELIWQEYYDIWSAHDQDPAMRRNYQGRSNLKLPQIRKEVETMTRRLVKATFPEDYLKADPTLITDQNLATTNTQVLRHYFDNIMHIKQKSEPWVKQAVLYGTSPLRVQWKKSVNDVYFRERKFKADEMGKLEPYFANVKKPVTLYDAPKMYLCDLFQTWVYPLTATDPSEIQRTYYRTKVTYEQLEDKFKEGTSIDPSFLKDEGKQMDVEFDQTQQRLAQMGETGYLMGQGSNKVFDLLEIWGTAEIDGKIIPYVCEVVNETHCIRLQQNPFWHQTPPFLWWRYILPPGPEFYGRGMPEASIAIQHQLDDVLNQTMDSTTLALQSVTVVNPAFAPNAESFEVEPNAIWWADPSAVKQFEFPDLSDRGLKNASSLRSIITEMSDNQPQLPDPIAGKARSTGQAQLAINEWQTDLYSFVDRAIIEALQPLAGQVHSLLQQNIPDDSIIRITGKYAGSWVNKVVTPNDIVGRFDFRWMGAIAVENQSIKVQQMLQFLKVIPMMPPDAGVNINWQNLIIKLIRDGFQIRDVENIISTENMNDSTSPEIENKILDMNASVQVSERDDDDAHISSHTMAMNKEKDPYKKAQFNAHIIKHQEQKSKKAQAFAQAEAMMAQQMQMAQNPKGPPKADNPMGNQGQLSQTTDPADLARGLGV